MQLHLQNDDFQVKIPYCTEYKATLSLREKFQEIFLFFIK